MQTMRVGRLIGLAAKARQPSDSMNGRAKVVPTDLRKKRRVGV